MRNAFDPADEAGVSGDRKETEEVTPSASEVLGVLTSGSASLLAPLGRVLAFELVGLKLAPGVGFLNGPADSWLVMFCDSSALTLPSTMGTGCFGNTEGVWRRGLQKFSVEQ